MPRTFQRSSVLRSTLTRPSRALPSPDYGRAGAPIGTLRGAWAIKSAPPIVEIEWQSASPLFRCVAFGETGMQQLVVAVVA